MGWVRVFAVAFVLAVWVGIGAMSLGSLTLFLGPIGGFDFDLASRIFRVSFPIAVVCAFTAWGLKIRYFRNKNKVVRDSLE